MNTTDFSLLFPEVDNPSKLLNSLTGIAHSRNLPDHEFQDALHVFSQKRSNYPGYIKNPEGYITTCIKNACATYLKEEGKTTSFDDNQIIETYVEPDFDAKDVTKKLNDFYSKLASYDLTLQETRVCKILIDVAGNDHSSILKYNKQVQEYAAIENITYDNLRKILERIREKLKGNNGLRDMLTFGTTEDHSSIESFINLMTNFMTSPQMGSYRFSQNELENMIELKNQYFANGISINRFPEVYYTDFFTALQNYPSLENTTRIKNTPDYLGAYLYEVHNGESKEGIVILFKDKIQEFCESINADIDDVRFVVLMHELGHWISHWAHSEENYWKLGRNWKFGFNYPNMQHVLEGIANLTAFWHCKTNEEKRVLDLLTPKNQNNTPDSSNPYGVYTLFIKKDKSEILNKLIQIRTLFYLDEKEMLNFLISDFTDLAEYMASFPEKNFIRDGFFEEISQIDDYGLKTLPLFNGKDEKLRLTKLFPAYLLPEDIDLLIKGSTIFYRRLNSDEYPC